jgi:hypothetical protein
MDGPATAGAPGPKSGFRAGRSRRVLLASLLLASGAGPAAAWAQEATGSPWSRPHVWLDARGEPLPFQTDDEILEFLRTARVLSREEIETGITRPHRLLLEKDGTRAHAIFRHVNVERRTAQIGPRFYQRFRDSHAHECAAYALARWLGLDNVPPVVARGLGGKDGSVQIWIENARDRTSEEFGPPSAVAWVAQIWDMELFDNLILNVDRNAGNTLVGEHYRLWLVDHTRAFQPLPELLDPARVSKVNRRVWDRLVATTEEDLTGALGDFLNRGQLRALAKRRELLVDHVERLLAERGEEVVLY